MALLEASQVDGITTEFQLRKEELKVRLEMVFLYEKRTDVLERIAMALEHRNTKQFHSV